MTTDDTLPSKKRRPNRKLPMDMDDRWKAALLKCLVIFLDVTPARRTCGWFSVDRRSSLYANNFFFSLQFPCLSKSLINAGSSLRGLNKKFPAFIRVTFRRNPPECEYSHMHMDMYVCAYIRTAITVLWLNRRIKSSRYLFRHDGYTAWRAAYLNPRLFFAFAHEM